MNAMNDIQGISKDNFYYKQFSFDMLTYYLPLIKIPQMCVAISKLQLQYLKKIISWQLALLEYFY